MTHFLFQTVAHWLTINYKLSTLSIMALDISTNIFIHDEHFTVNLSQEGNPSLLRYFRINPYWGNSDALLVTLLYINYIPSRNPINNSLIYFDCDKNFKWH